MEVKIMKLHNVKIKRLHPNSVVPKYAKAGDAGMDLTAVSRRWDEYDNLVYGTGLAFEIPEGYVGLVFPRSSCSSKKLIMSNCVGVIDSGYRGEVTLKFKPTTTNLNYKKDIYELGDRIGQIIIIPYPKIEFVEVEELSSTERGEGGYGSTGK